MLAGSAWNGGDRWQYGMPVRVLLAMSNGSEATKVQALISAPETNNAPVSDVQCRGATAFAPSGLHGWLRASLERAMLSYRHGHGITSVTAYKRWLILVLVRARL